MLSVQGSYLMVSLLKYPSISCLMNFPQRIDWCPHSLSSFPSLHSLFQCFGLIRICQFLQYGLTHISAGDLLRAEVAAGSENGNLAKEYMTKGLLVPSEIVVKVLYSSKFYFGHTSPRSCKLDSSLAHEESHIVASRITDP